MMSKLEIQNQLKDMVDRYKVAGEAERNKIEKERRKLGKALMSLSDIEHEEKVINTMEKREMMTYSDIFWLFSVGVGANFILNRIGLKASYVDSIDFSSASNFYKSQFEVREKR